MTALASYRHSAHVREPPQTVIVLRSARQLQHFKRSTQVHIQTAFLRLSIQGRRTVENRISGVHKPVVIVRIKTELRQCNIAAKNADLGLQVFVKFRKRQVQLKSIPKAKFRLASSTPAYQQV